MDTLNLKPKYRIGQKLIYIKTYFYGNEFDSVICYPITIQAITIYDDCITYLDLKFNEIDEKDILPYNPNIIGEYIINEIERNIDKWKQ